MHTDRATPIWPFPGTDWSWAAYPPHNLPPPRFSVGDRVQTRWGRATVVRIHDWEWFGSRAYHLRDDGSDAPPGFGKTWSESDMEPVVDLPAGDEDDELPPCMAAPRAEAPQLELF